jgi:hypothetical protein
MGAGEREEFANGDLREAAASYRAAVDLAVRSRQSGEARLALARVSAKLGDQREAMLQHSALLQLGLDDADPQGIPYALYAATALTRRDTDAALPKLFEAAESGFDIPPEALYLARQALDAIIAIKHGSSAASVRARLDDRIRRAEQAASLRDDFSGLGLVPTVATVADDRSSRWSLFGRDPWFIALSADSARGLATLVAVDAARIIDEVNRSRGLEGGLNGRVALGASPTVRESEDRLPWHGVSFIYSAGSRSVSGAFA